MFAGLGLAFERDVIAIGEGGDAQASFDLGEILVVEAENERGVTIVFEGERDFRFRVNRLRSPCGEQRVVDRRQAFASSLMSRPPKEFEPAAMIFTLASRPTHAIGPSTCTACI